MKQSQKLNATSSTQQSRNKMKTRIELLQH